MGQAEYILKFILVILIVEASWAVNIKMTNLECKLFEKRIGEFTKCSIKAIKRDVTELNLYVRLAMKPLNNISVNLRFAKRGANKLNILYQYTINACEFLQSSHRNPLADLFYNFFGLEKYSNLNHSCPYNHDLILDHCQLNMQPLNVLAIAKGDYKIFTNWYFSGKRVGVIDLSLSVM